MCRGKLVALKTGKDLQLKIDLYHMKYKEKLNMKNIRLLFAMVLLLSLIGADITNAEVLFAVSFDETHDADVAAGGDPVEDFGSLGLGYLRPDLTVGGPALWGESAYYGADALQARYASAGNVDMQFGTLDWFMLVEVFPEPFTTDYRHVLNIAGCSIDVVIM